MVNPAARSMIPMIPDPIGRSASEAIPIPDIVDALLYGHTEAIEFSFAQGSKDLLLRSLPLDPFGRLVIIQDVSLLRKAEPGNGRL